MPKAAKSLQDTSFLTAALEGLELQRNRLEDQIRQVRAMLGGRRGRAARAGVSGLGKPARKRQLSAAARKRIALAQKRRWAEYRKKMAGAKEG